jgi:FkbM family methyltransferase
MRPAACDPPEIESQLWAGLGGEVGWDIGANCGQSVPRMRNAARRVVCFEPAQESFEVLQRIYGSVEDFAVRQLAVSDHDGEVTLGVLEQQIATGQLVSPGTHGMEWDPATGWDDIPNRVVPCRTVDSLAREYGKPDFIKVDTEGHELKVLQGAIVTLARGTDWLIEFHSPELHEACEEILLGGGYDPYVIRHPHYPKGGHMWRQHGWLKAFRPPREPFPPEVATRPMETIHLP